MDDVFQKKELKGLAKGKEYRAEMVRMFRLQDILGKDFLGGTEIPPAVCFSYESNTRVLKYLKKPADTVFRISADGGFKHEFYDNEQTAREFIVRSPLSGGGEAQNTKELEIRWQSLRKELLGETDSLKRLKNLGVSEETQRALWNEFWKLLVFYEDEGFDFGVLFADKDDAESEFDSVLGSPQRVEQVVTKLCSLSALQIHIASYGDMCYTCQGTYWYDLDVTHDLERSLLTEIVQRAIQLCGVPSTQGSYKKKGTAATSALPLFEKLYSLTEEIKESADPRTEFFTECCVSVLASSSHTNTKAKKPHVSLRAILPERGKQPTARNWSGQNKELLP